MATIQENDTYVNLVVNNASVGGVKNDFVKKSTVAEMSQSLFSCTFETWDEILHLNSTAMYFVSGESSQTYTSRSLTTVSVAFLPLLVAAKGPFPNTGSIINVSSMSGITKQSQVRYLSL